MTEILMAWLLNKLKRHRYIGGKHTDTINVRKGADPQDYPEIEDIIKDLVKSGNILAKPTSYGKHISLNPRLIKEIDVFIQKHLTEVKF
ncbi:MAG: hypothetical protein HYT70_00245 [Candidatus Aenigmarchaeota archaeon]|nr:hypothetical protein [Candidatus Aenigmarchaeota archaeon]